MEGVKYKNKSQFLKGLVNVDNDCSVCVNLVGVYILPLFSWENTFLTYQYFRCGTNCVLMQSYS